MCVCVCRRRQRKTERPCPLHLSHPGARWASQLPSDAKKLSPLFPRRVWMCACMHVCLCKCVRAANSAVTWPHGEGLWGMSFSEPWPHSTLLSPKKNLERAAADWQAESGQNLQSGGRQRQKERVTVEKKWREAHEAAERDKTTQEGADGMTGMRNTDCSSLHYCR